VAVWLGLRIGLAGVFAVEPTSIDRGEGLVVDLAVCDGERKEELKVVEERKRMSQYQP